MRISTPVFSEGKKRKKTSKCVTIRCSVEEDIWISFKTLVLFKRLDIKDVLNEIIMEWINNFGGKHFCSNCRKIVDDDNRIIIVVDGVREYLCYNCCENIKVEI